MRTTFVFLVTFAVLLAGMTAPAQAGDKEDIMALINEYNRLDEVGDMMAQARLMTAERIYVIPGERLTSAENQAWNMRAQAAAVDRAKQAAPNDKTFITAVDPVIRVYGNAAVANFIRVIRVVPEEGTPPPSPPVVITLVLVKQDGQWKIDLTQYTATTPPTTTAN